MGFKRRPQDAASMLAAAHGKQEQRLAQLEACLLSPDDIDSDQVAAILEFFNSAYLRHLTDEEESILSRIADDALVAKLASDHNDQRALLCQMDAALREGRHHDLAAAGSSFARLLRRHSQLEDQQLLPLVEKLPKLAQEQAYREMQARRGR